MAQKRILESDNIEKPMKIRKYLDEEISNLRLKSLFLEKWIILKQLECHESVYCYLVCDKSIKNFGKLSLCVSEFDWSPLDIQLDFLVKVCYDVEGVSLEDCLKCEPEDEVVYLNTIVLLAIDIIQTLEILISTGYVLRDFDVSDWKFNTKSRMIYLANLSNIGVLTDKRYSNGVFKKSTSNEFDCGWLGDFLYAPRKFHENPEC
ncbi:unnamed protein product [Caenorhabditis bovis]|uniref:Uncharacterized protein n=1 Tax=Caenorhabditis bovis TaxID=2654633 RepID=A0A8S1ECL2_9PELO|nr:unnamed protein product [Caenorhabditis bovis]